MSSTEELYANLSGLLTSSNICKPCNPSVECRETLVCFPERVVGVVPGNNGILEISGSGIEAKWCATVKGAVSMSGGGGGTLCCCPCCLIMNVSLYTESTLVGTGSFIINLKDCCNTQTANLYCSIGAGSSTTTKVIGSLNFPVVVQNCSGTRTITIPRIEMVGTG